LIPIELCKEFHESSPPACATARYGLQSLSPSRDTHTSSVSFFTGMKYGATWAREMLWPI